MRQAIITMGFPLSGKTKYYNLFYKDKFKYFDAENKEEFFFIVVISFKWKLVTILFKENSDIWFNLLFENLKALE